MKKSNLCKTICLLASVSILLVSCATPQTKTGKGGAYGAAGGAVLGAIIGQAAGRDTKATLIGAAIVQLLAVQPGPALAG